MYRRPAIEGATPCLHCGKKHTLLPLDALLHPGFGGWNVTCSDRRYKRFPEDGEEHVRLRAVDEFAAAHDPSCRASWEITIDGPLWGGTYQRQAQGHWVLVEQNEGFA